MRLLWLFAGCVLRQNFFVSMRGCFWQLSGFCLGIVRVPSVICLWFVCCLSVHCMINVRWLCGDCVLIVRQQGGAPGESQEWVAWTARKADRDLCWALDGIYLGRWQPWKASVLAGGAKGGGWRLRKETVAATAMTMIREGGCSSWFLFFYFFARISTGVGHSDLSRVPCGCGSWGSGREV